MIIDAIETWENEGGMVRTEETELMTLPDGVINLDNLNAQETETLFTFLNRWQERIDAGLIIA